MTTDLTLILPDRIGSLATAFAVFRDAGVDIDGCAGFPAWAGEGILHVLIDDVEAARAALNKAGIAIREERELLITPPLSDDDAVTRTLERIAAASVNVDLIYQLRDGRLALGVNRLERAQRAIAEPPAGIAEGVTVQP